MSSDDEFIVLEAAAQKASALEFNGFAVVLCFFVVHVRIPHRIVFVADFDDVRVDVKRKRIFDIIDFDIVRAVFVNDVAAAVDCAHDFVVRHLVHVLRKMLENNRLGGFQLVHCEISHILVIGQISSRIRKTHFLVNRPSVRHAAVQAVE